MTPSFALYVMLSIAALLVAQVRANAKQVAWASILVNYGCFTCLYLLVSTQVAQDRSSYFAWYDIAPNLLGKPEDRDKLFTLFLAALPRKMDETQFYVVFASLFYLNLALLLWQLTRQKLISYRQLPFVLLIILSDRLFMDESLNSTRGSLALLLYLNGLARPSMAGRALFWGAALGVHTALASIMMGIYVILHPRWVTTRYASLLPLIGMALFGIRLISSKPIFSDLELFNILEVAQDSERMIRGLTSTSTLTRSLAIQIVIAVLAPYLAARNPQKTASDAAPERLQHFWLSAVGASAFGLILYPDFQLAQRIFFVPLVIFPMFVPLKWLKPLSLAKVGLILTILFTEFR